METTVHQVTAGELRVRMKARRVTVRALAREAGLQESNLSSILAGKEYLGADRRARIEASIIKLGLDQAAPAPEVDGPVFEIRQS